MAGLSFEHGTGSSADANRAFKKQLNKVYGWYTGGFIAFVLVLASSSRWACRDSGSASSSCSPPSRCMPASAS